MKKFNVWGNNYSGNFVDVVIEAKTRNSAVNKFNAEYGGIVYGVEEVKAEETAEETIEQEEVAVQEISEEEQTEEIVVSNMTKYQQRKIEEIREIMLDLVGHRETKEIKEETITEIGYGIISMVIEVGSIGDEGTTAEIICRDRAHVFIGPKGGCYTYSKARSGVNKGKDVRYDDNVRGVIWRCVLDK